MVKFECNLCKSLKEESEGIWVNNGGSWSMVLICEDCYKKSNSKKVSIIKQIVGSKYE